MKSLNNLSATKADLADKMLTLYQVENKNLFYSVVGSYPVWLTKKIQKIKPLLSYGSLAYHRSVFIDAEERLKRPFWLFVVGEGNFGKSTLVNAILGQESKRIVTLLNIGFACYH